MRLIDADAMAESLEHDVELDARALDSTELVGPEREHVQFDKDCKQNCMWYLTEQPTVPASPWHRVEDELPKSGEFGEIVLACNDVGTVKAAYLLSNGKWYAANNTDWDAWTWMPNVTHWMPLPEPPKEDE